MNLSDMARELGKKGGKVKSPAKTKAVRLNGKLGGRPKNVIAGVDFSESLKMLKKLKVRVVK